MDWNLEPSFMVGREFGPGDKVVLETLREKMSKNTSLAKQAQSSDSNIFKDLFKKVFEETIVESYEESQESYTSLLSDKNKFDAVMSVLAEVLYRDFTKKMYVWKEPEPMTMVAEEGKIEYLKK